MNWEQLDERLRTAARTYRRLGNQSAESMFLESADSITELQAENAKLRELVRVLHVAHVDMVNRYKDNETECIWEYGCDIENNIRKLESECEKECHRFDAAMRELGIEVDK